MGSLMGCLGGAFLRGGKSPLTPFCPPQILLPLINQYFHNHCLYFLSTPAKVLGSGGHASNKEKEMITRWGAPPDPQRWGTQTPSPLGNEGAPSHPHPRSWGAQGGPPVPYPLAEGMWGLHCPLAGGLGDPH